MSPEIGTITCYCPIRKKLKLLKVISELLEIGKSLRYVGPYKLVYKMTIETEYEFIRVERILWFRISGTDEIDFSIDGLRITSKSKIKGLTFKP